MESGLGDMTFIDGECKHVWVAALIEDTGCWAREAGKGGPTLGCGCRIHSLFGRECCILRERFIWGLALGTGEAGSTGHQAALSTWSTAAASAAPGLPGSSSVSCGGSGSSLDSRAGWASRWPSALRPGPRRGGLTGVGVGAAWPLRPERALRRPPRLSSLQLRLRAAVGQVPPGLRAPALSGRPWLGFQLPPASEGHRTGPGSPLSGAWAPHLSYIRETRATLSLRSPEGKG